MIAGGGTIVSNMSRSVDVQTSSVRRTAHSETASRLSIAILIFPPKWARYVKRGPRNRTTLA